MQFSGGQGRLLELASRSTAPFNRVVELRAAGNQMPFKDSLIAATALVHDLVVATRNRSDFAQAGVRIVNPFTR